MIVLFADTFIIVMKGEDELGQGEQESEEQQSLTTKYNLQLLKNYFLNAKVTVIALIVIWIVFLI